MKKENGQKRGRGRPPKYNEPSVRVETSIPASLFEWIEERYDNRSDHIARCVMLYNAGRGYDPPVEL